MDRKRSDGWLWLLVWLGVVGSGVAFWLALAAWVFG
jgi:hypothetical protein